MCSVRAEDEKNAFSESADEKRERYRRKDEKDAYDSCERLLEVHDAIEAGKYKNIVAVNTFFVMFK